MKITAFTFLIMFKEQVSRSNLYKNKSHFNYMRFIKLLSLEHKQNKLLCKVKTVVLSEYSSHPYFGKIEGKEKHS